METEDRREIIALAVLETAVRGREIGGGPVTYRRALTGVVPGHRLTIAVARTWRFRNTLMIGGALLHAGLSLRAMRQAGFALPDAGPGGIRCPGDDARLLEGIEAFERSEWGQARARLAAVLEEEPGCLRAHVAMGSMLAQLEHREAARLHLTAAIRLGLGAVGDEGPLASSGPVERDLLCAAICRAELLRAEGAVAEAESDLRRALRWDPSDALDAGSRLAALQMAAPGPA